MNEPRIRLILHTLSAAAEQALADRPLPAELGKRQYRRMQAAVSKSGYDAATHTVTMSVSSETPVSRYGGVEILSHAPGALDTSRLDAGIPLLFNHDWDKLIGRSQAYSLKGGKLTITNKFATNPLAREKEQDVADEILVDVSIGYQNLKVDITEDAQGNRTFTATEWMLYENSLVTVPADFSVGVNRAAGDEATDVVVTFRKLQADDPDEASTDEEDDDEDEDDDDEERKKQRALEAAASSTDSTTTTQPTQQRTQTMEPVVATVPATVTVDLQAQERARVQGLANLRNLRGDLYTEANLNADINSGIAVAAASNAVAERAIAAAASSNVPSIASNLLNGLSAAEQRNYSRAGAVRAAINQLRPGTFAGKEEGGFEREFSQTLRTEAEKAGITNLGPGILTPGVTNARFAEMEAKKRTIASGGAAGTATNFTQVIVPPIELLRSRTVCMKMGARMIPGLHGTPQFTRQNAAAASSWLAEGAAVTATDPGLDFFKMTPNRLSMASAYYRDFLALSNLSIDSFLSEDRNAVLARSLDYAGLAGSGTNNVPLGLLNRTGLATVLTGGTRSANGTYTAGAGGTPPTFVDLNAMESTISTSNGDIGTMAWATTPKVRSSMRSIPQLPGSQVSGFIQPNSKIDANGIQEGPLGYNLLASTQLPTGFTVNAVAGLHPLIFGVWDQMLFGDWDLNEIIADNITGAAQALYKITEHGYYDTNIRHLECFCVAFVLPS